MHRKNQQSTQTTLHKRWHPLPRAAPRRRPGPIPPHSTVVAATKSVAAAVRSRMRNPTAAATIAATAGPTAPRGVATATMLVAWAAAATAAARPVGVREGAWVAAAAAAAAGAAAVPDTTPAAAGAASVVAATSARRVPTMPRFLAVPPA